MTFWASRGDRDAAWRARVAPAARPRFDLSLVSAGAGRRCGVDTLAEGQQAAVVPARIASATRLGSTPYSGTVVRSGCRLSDPASHTPTSFRQRSAEIFGPPYGLSCQLARWVRWRVASYKRTVAAVAAFRELAAPVIGIRTMASHASRHPALSPWVSLPISTRRGPVRS